MARLDKYEGSGDALVVKSLFAALTSDVITEYSFGIGWDSLGKEDLDEGLWNGMHEACKGSWHLGAYFPVLGKVPRYLPERWAVRMFPAMEFMLPWFEVSRWVARNDGEIILLMVEIAAATACHRYEISETRWR